MYLIVGLGNPEEEYSNTRHNMGFDSINILAEQNEISLTKKKFNAIYGSGFVNGEKVILIKPQTYMNLSGQAVKQFMDFYKLKNDDIIIVYDDMDIEPSIIKIRKKGGSGGHNGMKSIIEHLGIEEFTRIRIGIGRPDNQADKINYVIGAVTNEEQAILEKGVKQSVLAIEEIVKNGVDTAMNKFN